MLFANVFLCCEFTLKCVNPALLFGNKISFIASISVANLNCQ